MTTVQPENISLDWMFGLQWVVANFISWSIASVFFGGVIKIISLIVGTTSLYPDMRPMWIQAIIYWGISTGLAFVFVIVSGIFIGLAQWLVLRWRFPDFGKWAITTTIGWILGWSIGYVILLVIVNPILGVVLAKLSVDIGITGRVIISGGTLLFFGAMCGAMLGVVQSLILQKYISQANLWVLISAIAMATVIVTSMLLPGVIYFPYIVEFLQRPGYWGFYGTIYGAVTGLGLIWLSHRPWSQMQIAKA